MHVVEMGGEEESTFLGREGSKPPGISSNPKTL